MVTKVKIEGVHKKQPIAVEIEVEYTLTEALGMMKAYPELAKQMFKLINKQQG